jgi:hypothetical protein
LHLTKDEIIAEYVRKLGLSTKELEKVNRLRKQANMQEICF